MVHFHKRQKIGKQNHRAEQSVIGKIVNILPASQVPRNIRKQISGCVKPLPEVIRNDAVLANPVYL